MTARSHTHRAHCQRCGSLQALGNQTRVIAKHGYRVAGFGYFAGTCTCSDRSPLEFDRTLCDAMCKDLTAWANNQSVIADLYETGKRVPKGKDDSKRELDPVTQKWNRVSVFIDWADMNEWDRKSLVQSIVWRHRQEAKAGHSHVAMMQDLAKRVYGQPPIPVEDTRPAKVAVHEGVTFHFDGKVFTITRLCSMGYTRTGRVNTVFATTPSEEKPRRFSINDVRRILRSA